MHWPRVSVRWLMVAVAVVAVDIGVMRWAAGWDLIQSHSNPMGFGAFASIPPTSLLVVAAVNVGLGLVKSGQSQPFSTGYLVVGALTSLSVFFPITGWVFFWLLEKPVTLVIHSRFWGADSPILVGATLFALPQIALASVGGLVAERYALTLTVKGRAAQSDGRAD